MRVIAGTARSLKLKAPEGLDTRPTTDRIKETLFNMIQYDLPGCRFLDLFSGSGAIGIEAISRGAKEAVFVEKDRKAIQCIEDNIHHTKFESQCQVIAKDVISALYQLNGKGTFDIIFMDPPYGNELEQEVLEYLASSDLITEDTLMITEADLTTDFDYLSSLGLQSIKEKIYKTNKHIFIKKKGGNPSEN